MRHFENKIIAERYDIGRPRLHELALRAFIEAIEQKAKWSNVLDIACGTGHSTVPLLDLSNYVMGIDISPSMIEIAKRNHSNIEFIVSSAESLPRDMKQFDAIFIANGFHWINKQELLSVIKALLKENGWFVIYGLGSPKVMLGNNNYESWYKNEYWKRYPNPTNAGGSFEHFVSTSNGLLGKHSLINIEQNIEMTCTELRAMITTQSNIHQAIENKISTIQEIDSYLDSVLPKFFTNEKESFPFNIQIQYSKRL